MRKARDGFCQPRSLRARRVELVPLDIEPPVVLLVSVADDELVVEPLVLSIVDEPEVWACVPMLGDTALPCIEPWVGVPVLAVAELVVLGEVLVLVLGALVLLAVVLLVSVEVLAFVLLGALVLLAVVALVSVEAVVSLLRLAQPTAAAAAAVTATRARRRVSWLMENSFVLKMR